MNKFTNHFYYLQIYFLKDFFLSKPFDSNLFISVGKLFISTSFLLNHSPKEMYISCAEITFGINVSTNFGNLSHPLLMYNKIGQFCLKFSFEDFQSVIILFLLSNSERYFLIFSCSRLLSYLPNFGTTIVFQFTTILFNSWKS